MGYPFWGVEAGLMERAGSPWSISALGNEFGLHFNTVKRLITGVMPDGEIRGNAAYRIRTVAPFLADRAETEETNVQDLDSMSAKDRRDWVASERDLNKLRAEAGELCLAEDVREELATMAKVIVQAIDTMPDILEREAGLTGAQVEVVTEVCDRVREQMYEVAEGNERASELE